MNFEGVFVLAPVPGGDAVPVPSAERRFYFYELYMQNGVDSLMEQYGVRALQVDPGRHTM